MIAPAAPSTLETGKPERIPVTSSSTAGRLPLLLFAVLISTAAGCATAPEVAFQPPLQHDPGPWPVEVHDSFLQGFWVSCGPYRTDRSFDSEVTPATDIGLQQVNFEVNQMGLRALKVYDAYGDPIYLAAGVSLEEAAIEKTGFARLLPPTSLSGVIASGGSPIAEYQKVQTDSGFLGMGQTWRETLTIGDETLTIGSYSEPSSRGALDIFGTKTGIEFLNSAGVQVARLQQGPHRELWIDNTLPKPVQQAVVAHVIDTVVAGVHEAKRQQAANNAMVSGRLASGL